jgi:hypothetical protein
MLFLVQPLLTVMRACSLPQQDMHMASGSGDRDIVTFHGEDRIPQLGPIAAFAVGAAALVGFAKTTEEPIQRGGLQLLACVGRGRTGAIAMISESVVPLQDIATQAFAGLGRCMGMLPFLGHPLPICCVLVTRGKAPFASGTNLLSIHVRRHMQRHNTWPCVPLVGCSRGYDPLVRHFGNTLNALVAEATGHKSSFSPLLALPCISSPLSSDIYAWFKKLLQRLGRLHGIAAMDLHRGHGFYTVQWSQSFCRHSRAGAWCMVQVHGALSMVQKPAGSFQNMNTWSSALRAARSSTSSRVKACQSC